MANKSFNFKKDNVLEFINTSFNKKQEVFQKYKDRKLGFEQLDKYLEGVRPEFFVIASEPSNGKTTLLTQFTDNLAEAGETVLFFSLEQSQFELVAKGISRETIKNMKDKEVPESSLDIMQNINASELRKRAIAKYKEISKNIYIIDGTSGMTVNDITNYVEEFITHTGVKPIVMVDYLQKLKGTDEKLSERKQVDYNVTALKGLSVGKEIPVFVISSLNRASYNTTIGLEGLKESGDIEYGADVVIALQLKNLENVNEEKSKDKKKTLDYIKNSGTRIVDLVVLKNRNRQMKFNDTFMYYPAYNYFLESLESKTSEKKFGSFNKKN